MTGRVQPHPSEPSQRRVRRVRTGQQYDKQFMVAPIQQRIAAIYRTFEARESAN